MGFIVRILFSGLIVFVPSQDGQKVTVLLLKVNHNHQLSDGSALGHHTPIVLARAGSCSGDCPTRDADLAQFLFADKSLSVALDSLEAALGGGGGWILNGSDLSIAKGSASDPDFPALSVRRNVRTGIIPNDANERGDFDWVADLTQICGDGCPFDSAIHGTQPPSDLIAARLVLRTGNVFTYSVARIGSDVTPVQFKRLDGIGGASPYSQAVATWVGADIAVSGSSIELVETKFADGTQRSMTLTPDANGKVEIAMLNLPPFIPPSSPFTGTPGIGKHFETYYDLAATPPAAATRLVPYPGAAPGAPAYSQVSWDSIHPQTELWSDLLNAIRMNVGRTLYEQLLCPPSQGQP